MGGTDFSDSDEPPKGDGQQDNPHAMLAQAVAGHYHELHNFARARTGDTTIGEDLVQEACLRAIHADISELKNIRAYMFRILNNLITDHFRKLRRTRERFAEREAPDAAEDKQGAEEHLIAKQRLQILQQAIDELPPRCRECFILRRFENLSHAEIAAHMNISKSAVEKHLAAASVHCTNRMRERG